MPKGVYPRQPGRKHRITSDQTCRACLVALDDSNWSPANRRSGNKTCNDCYRTYQRDHYHANRERRCQQLRDSRKVFRTEVFAQYGSICACCGEHRQPFLTIDHVHNDGKQHRQEIGPDPLNLYRWLRDHGYPKDGFQILCRNCNYAKFSQGVCPHEQERLDGGSQETGHA